MTEPPDDTDQRFAANFRAAREQAGLSQRQVADQMRERGLPWHQQTVYRLESGEQPVKLREAEHLAAIVGTEASALTRPTGVVIAAYDILAAARKVREQRRQLDALAAVQERDIARLRAMLERARENGTAERLRGEIRVALAALGEPGAREAAAEPQSGHRPAGNES